MAGSSSSADGDAPTAVVVGLGNPGDEYAGTRHNVGFAVVEAVARLRGREFFTRGRARVARGVIEGGVERPFLLAQPQTYMNNSGRAVRDLLADLGAGAPLLVVCDDFHLPLGRLRCRRKGSAGGQNGLASILDHVSGRDVPRLRVGIGDPGRVPSEEYVLRPFKRGEQADVAEAVERAAAAVDDWLAHRDLDRLIEACNAGA